MNRLCIGDKLQIQCYKHNKELHRMWKEAVVLDEGKDFLICGNDKTVVIESNGNTWKTKEPAIMYFFKDKWFNVIAQLKKDGISYYCNIATPYIIEDGVIKSYLKETKTLLTYSTNDKSGKYSETIYKRLEYNKQYSLVEIEIKTGRKNQIMIFFRSTLLPLLLRKESPS